MPASCPWRSSSPRRFGARRLSDLGLIYCGTADLGHLARSPSSNSYGNCPRTTRQSGSSPLSLAVELDCNAPFVTTADLDTGAFVFENVRLVPGKNEFAFTATDRAGNESERTIYTLYLGRLEITKALSTAARTLVWIGDAGDRDPDLIKSTRTFIDSALADLTKAIELDPKYAKAYSNRGLVYIYRGDLDKAIIDCTKAIGLDPKDAAAHRNRGNVYKKMGDLDKAIADLTCATPTRPLARA